jgi:hypothetical protein
MFRALVSPIKDRSVKMQRSPINVVDMQAEKRNDPKYKTELCKGFSDNGFCPYGNKCRFAHGKQELSVKPINATRYKQKECKSFKEQGFCMYGSRCNFKHDERKLKDINMTYFSVLLKDLDEDPICSSTDTSVSPQTKKKSSKRLQAFEELRLNESESDEDSGTQLKESNNISTFHPKLITLY